MELLSVNRPSLQGEGTADANWLASPELAALPRWNPAPSASGRVVVVGPHPDDEILGTGRTAARLVTAGAQHVLVAVTDGEASHRRRALELQRMRPRESEVAAAQLGTTPGRTHRLGLPDGSARSYTVARALEDIIEPSDLVLAPWEGDGHPDHAEVGLGAREACGSKAAELLSYLVWAWHWAQPAQLPWEQSRRADLGPDIARAKRRAVACFQTQTERDDPILAPTTLLRLTRDFEVLLEP